MERLRRIKIISFSLVIFVSIWCLEMNVAHADDKILSFLRYNSKHQLVEKPVIIILQKIKGKQVVIQAVFPDNSCINYPDKTILLLPHVFRETKTGPIKCQQYVAPVKLS